tara:strand:+ start:155 stop:1168 length:1014 start_codon:yes stop_codon:yes gene_type:complete
MKKIVVISNDKIFINKNHLSTKYNDTINIIDALQNYFEIYLISKKNKVRDNFSLSIRKNINVLNFISLFRLRKKKLKFLMISITPRNLFFFILIKFIFKDIDGYLYLRSDGFEEYKNKIGIIGHIIYGCMLKYLEHNFKIISVSKKIKCSKIHYLVTPSEINNLWLKNFKKANLSFPKILYLGRYRKEKGIYSLLRLFEKINYKYKLTIAGDDKNVFNNSSKISVKNEISDNKKLLSLYDEHNIFILPSYTEGAPKVILESLARKRPVIIFKEIEHVKLNYKGVFVCQRKISSLTKCIEFIIKNYKKIQLDMKQNELPTKNIFQSQLVKILDDKNAN